MQRILAAVTAVVFAACGSQTLQIEEQPEAAKATTGLTWEEFVAHHAFKEPDTDTYIADGDTVFHGLKQLREFYDLHVQQGQLIVNRIGSADDKWDAQRRLNLTYCVSNTFGTNKPAVVQAMAEAAQSWMAVADVRFIYVAAQDASCTASNSNVLFDVNPVNVKGEYMARSFFPSNGRFDRNVLIDNTLLTESSAVKTGVLRHELGHVLGFRHEHTRPEAGTCFEDNAWRPLTPYDSASVMHYPQCNGTNSWTLPLTALDKQGVAALYGAPSGAGTTQPAPTTPGNVESFTASVARNATKTFGPFVAKPGTTFKVTMSGTGDADLYVRQGAAPTASSYDCRPYTGGSAEECTLTINAATPTVYVAAVGYTAADVSVRVEYAKAATQSAPAPTTTGTVRSATATGTLAAGQQGVVPVTTVVPGTQFKVSMSGTGDADLYVRFGAAPTLTAFDCRPYQNGSIEDCTVTVPAGQTQAFIMVNGYAASSYSLSINWTAP